MRAYDKKKRDKLTWKRLVRSGRMPNSQGQWVIGPATSTSFQHLRAGHRSERG